MKLEDLVWIIIMRVTHTFMAALFILVTLINLKHNSFGWPLASLFVAIWFGSSAIINTKRMYE